LTVDDTIVEGFNGAVVDQLKGTTHIDGDAEMTRKPVAGTTGNDAQGGIGMYQGASHLVDGTVASDSYHDVNTISSTLAGYLSSVTPILGEAQLDIELRMIEHLVDKFRKIVLFLRARYGIYNEYNVFFVAHRDAKLQKKHEKWGEKGINLC
jgi:hypothetical protein